MSGEQYFQVAAANIKNAILEKQKEIDAMKLQITKVERDFHDQKRALEEDRNVKSVQATRPEQDDVIRAKLLKEARDDQKAISDAEVGFKNNRDSLLKNIDALQRDIQGLQALANDLNRRAGTT